MKNRFSLSGIPWKKVLLGILLLALGATSGYFFATSGGLEGGFNTVRYSGNYRFISPPLYSEVPESLALPEYAPLKDAIADYAGQAMRSGNASDIGVYFRDLNENHWIGVNQTHTFAPGSLLKVATLMTAFRVTEARAGNLDKQLHLTFADDYDSGPQEYFPPRNPVQPGGTYTIRALLSQLIIESDNRAADALNYYFGLSELDKTLNDLNVPAPETAADETNTPRDYSHLFRALFNGSYLSPADSEQALDLLSQTRFTDGLAAGVPSGTLVAHKFGERTLEKGGSATDELHDCGIVYFPEHPYFLCVMTKGTDFPKLASVIKGISQIAWDHVTKRYR